jgi:anaerobic selenocysteine-containing dehydrogenase
LTETAAKADVHLAVRPGTDETLIANMLHVILSEDLWDKRFTDANVLGFEKFHHTLIQDRYSPEAGEKTTGVPSEKVRHLAHLYSNAPSAGIFTGNGLEHHGHGSYAMRLLAVLKAISGNLDIPGGDLFTPRPKLRDITKPLPPSDVPPIGADKYPVFQELRHEAHALCLADAVLDHDPYPIHGLIIAGGNPSLEWAGTHRTSRALKNLEFLMVIDVVQNPDSRFAHLILPACTFLERDEHYVSVYQNLANINLRRRVVEPAFGMPDQMIWVEMAKALGFGEYFPWRNCREGIDHIMGGLGLSYEDLAARGGRYCYAEREYRKYQEKGFNTPSGKVEIEPERLKECGLPGSPIREDAATISNAGTSKPITLTTGGNLLCYLHWQYRYLPRLRKIAPKAYLEIHPKTAADFGLSEEDMVEVITSQGGLSVKAHLTDRIRPDTVHLPQGWEEANANELTGLDQRDPVSGFPNLKAIECSLRKVSV